VRPYLQVYVDKLVKVAYENWDDVVEYDGEALIGFKPNNVRALEPPPPQPQRGYPAAAAPSASMGGGMERTHSAGADNQASEYVSAALLNALLRTSVEHLLWSVKNFRWLTRLSCLALHRFRALFSLFQAVSYMVHNLPSEVCDVLYNVCSVTSMVHNVPSKVCDVLPRFTRRRPAI
jgi:hypothetical protein